MKPIASSAEHRRPRVVGAATRAALALAALSLGWTAPLLAAPPSNSKLSIHLDGPYTGGAQAVINAHPRVIKIFFSCSCVSGPQLQAARDYKAGTPAGKVVLRMYSAQHFNISDDPTASANSFYNVSLAPAIGDMSAADKALIDYLEGPNETDSTPTFESIAAAQWFNTFWMQLATLISNAGFHPLFGSIAVGNPGGDTNNIHACMDAIVPALRRCQSLGGGWSYHDYSSPTMTKDLGVEIYYSLRYRQYYSYFATNYPDLANIPMVGTEGGGFNGWTMFGASYFEDWLAWHDTQIQQDSYFIGDTLFEIGDPGGWGTFDLEPIAGWLANYIATAAPSTPPDPPTGLSATAGDTQVSLAWNPASGASSYNVKRSTTTGGPYNTIATGVTSTNYTNTGLTNGTTYYYVVSATNSFGTSGNSVQVSATPAASNMNGNTPTGTNASLTAVQVTTDSNINGSFPGTLATDGSMSTKWCSNGNAPPHWIAVDLGSNKTVNGFIVRMGGAGGEFTSYNFKNFAFQSGPSINGPWTDEAAIDNTAQTNVVARTYNTPKSLRYLRLNITNAGIDNYARLYEFEIYAATPTSTPTITLVPPTLSTTCTHGVNAQSQSFTVRNSGTGTLNYSIGDNAAWLSAAPSSGTSTGETDTITVTYTTSALAIGNYTATITVTDAQSTNSPQTIPVTLVVQHVPGDLNADGWVDPADLTLWLGCQTGPDLGPPAPGCTDADIDHDLDVDQSDFAILQKCFSGPGVPADPHCAG